MTTVNRIGSARQCRRTPVSPDKVNGRTASDPENALNPLSAATLRFRKPDRFPL